MVKELNIMYLKRSLGMGFIEPTHVLSQSNPTKKAEAFWLLACHLPA